VGEVELMDNLRKASLTLAIALGLTMGLLWIAPQTAVAQEDEEQQSGMQQKVNPEDIRRGIARRGRSSEERRRLYFERVIRKVEPDWVGKPEKLPQYLANFEAQLIVDTRLFPFSVEAEWLVPKVKKNELDGTVRLTGFVGYEENRSALLQYLKFLGFENIDDQIESLPSDNLGERKFALVTAAHAFFYAKPVQPSEPLTNALLGDPVYLLRKEDNGWYLALSAASYVGYISGEQIVRVNADRFSEYQAGHQVYAQKDIPLDDSFIPLGAKLKWIANSDDGVQVQLPDRRKLALPVDAVRLEPDEKDPRIERILAMATQLLDTRYVWGGKTSEGVDCSGLIQTAFKAEGLNFPRDAYQQSYVGALSATRWYREGLKRGDTLYFLGSSGTITHTAIYLGDGQYLEASRGDVHYTSFDPGDENYDERKAQSFCFAKRLLD